MEDEFARELSKIFKEAADRIREQEGREINTEGFLVNPNQEFSNDGNVPQEDYNGFTNKELYWMVVSPLDLGCPVQLRKLTDEQISQIPFMRQAIHLMNLLSEKELKLTPKGKIPPKLVGELYEMGSHSPISDITQKTEDKIMEVYVLRGVLKDTGLIKERSGKMSLTAKGQRLLKNKNALMKEVIGYFFNGYNTGWYDTRGSYEIGNKGRVYSLWLLHHFGEDWMPLEFYKEEYFKAFPEIYVEGDDRVSCYKYRTFHRLFAIIGLCEINDGEEFRGKENMGKEVRKTPIVDMMFSFEEPEQI